MSPLRTLLVYATLSVSTGLAELSISEFLAVNGAGLEDKDGDRSDWIEIHNAGETSVDLTGYFLTDDPDNLSKWRLPKGSVPAGGQTIIHASGKDASSLFSSELHTNFSLASNGEYLALVKPDGSTVAYEYAPGYPEQRMDVSYGIGKDGTFGYFASPTPGEPNSGAASGLVDKVKFSVKRGYVSNPFQLELSSETPGASIRYSTNGKAPSLFNGKTYSGPIEIDGTMTIRARAEANGYINSPLKTHTYVFVTDVVKQDTMSANVTEDPVYGPLMQDALLEHPAVCLTTADTDISKTSEDPVSVEMFFPDGTDGFQIDAGVKRVGGHSLNAYPKNNMRLYFRSEYGDEKLRFPLYEEHPYTDVAADSFDQLNLRSGSHDSLFYLGATPSPQTPSNGQYLRNRWISDMQFLMGHESLRGRWVHVYINGTYWGHYQLLERNTQDYFASYLGGKKSDHVAINKGQPIGSSSASAWSEVRNSRNDYEDFKRRVDVINYVDYMLLNYYCGNDWDWNPEQNWGAGGPADPDKGGVKFIAWDSDIIFRRLNDNNLGKGGPHSMFPILMRDEDFATLVADRIQKHFHDDGLLTPGNVAKYYNIRAEEIRLSIVAETARWQGGRWTRDNQWQSELDRLNNDFFPNRTEEVLKQFRSKGWTGVVAAPRMSPLGGHVDSGHVVRITKGLFTRGTIIYTTDGTDPRLPGGDMAPNAQEFTSGFAIDETTTIKARVHNSDGWSAIIETRFVVDHEAASPDNLTISKIHYRPAAPSPEEIAAGFTSRKEFEFIALRNLSTRAVDLFDVRFSEGIQFHFKDAVVSSLAPGAEVLLARNPSAFRMRYGQDLPVAGSFIGSLSNDGEILRLTNDADVVLQELRYNDADPWPIAADGDGAFLVLQPDGQASVDDPSRWRASQADESPIGQGPPEPEGLTYATWSTSALSGGEHSEPESDPDLDGYVNVVEFLLGTNPIDPTSVPYQTISRTASGSVRYAFEQRMQVSGVSLAIERSNDLIEWAGIEPDAWERTTEAVPDRSGLERHGYVFASDGEEAPHYLRLRVLGP